MSNPSSRQNYGVIKDDDRVQEDQFAIISVDLLRMLIQRIKEPSEWYRPIHHHVLVQTLLAKLSQNFTSQTQPELCQSVLGLLALIAEECAK